MKTKGLLLVMFAMVVSVSASGQLNEYKYIIVPKKFEAFRANNQFQTSTLLKYYFTENGFNAVYDDALPEDLANNRCLGLTANILDNPTMFVTRLHIVLKDCKNTEVIRSIEGRSKVKDYADAYKEAIQEAFITFAGLDYHYEPKSAEKEAIDEPVTISFKDDVKSIKKKPDSLVVEQKATPDEQLYKSVEPVPSNIVKAEEKKDMSPTWHESLLYAQPVENGYQLVDSTPKVVLRLEETSMDNIFLTKYQGNSAMVFKKGEQWFLEYSENGEKHQIELQIKF